MGRAHKIPMAAFVLSALNVSIIRNKLQGKNLILTINYVQTEQGDTNLTETEDYCIREYNGIVSGTVLRGTCCLHL